MAAATEPTSGGRYAERRGRGRRPASMEFDEALYKDLQDIATAEDRSMASVVRQAVREYIDKRKRRKP